MPRNLLSVTSGVALLGLLLTFSILAWNRDPQDVVTQQAASGACLTASDAGFVFDFAGYVHNDDGTTTLTYGVANPNKKDISYVAFGTGDWERLEPSDGVTTTLELGTYHVEWTNNRGNPGFTSVKYETLFGGFSKGAAKTFTLVVSGFAPDATVQIEAKAGKDRGRVSFALGDPACDKTSPTPTPTPPFSPLPTPTPTPEGGVVLPTEPVVAECVFGPPAGGLPPDEPIIPLSAYSFSEPMLVLTNTAPIGIQQWLPDNKTLLITQESLENQLVSIELLDITRGEVSQIVEPRNYLKEPRWLSTNSTVIWRQSGIVQAGESGYWWRSFDPYGERKLSDNGIGAGTPHDIAPDGQEFIFMSLSGGTQPLIWNQEAQTLNGLPIDLAQWRYKKEQVFYPLRPFYPLWHPSGDKILFHDGTWAFLYDLTTKLGCEINMDSLSPTFPSIHDASWSPDGRYLLFKVALDPINVSIRGPHGMLLVLDTYTGNAIQYFLGNLVYGFSWAPDNQTVVITRQTGERIGGFDAAGTYLLNIRNGEYQQVSFGVALTIVNGKWSPDGTRMAFHCIAMFPDGYEIGTYRICASHVTINH